MSSRLRAPLWDASLTTLYRIFQLEKQIRQNIAPLSQDAESSPLLQGSLEDPDKVFSNALDRELEKICSFYQLKELEIYGEVDGLLKDEQGFEEDHNGDMDGSTARPPKTRPRSASIFQSFAFGQNKKRTSTISSNRQERRSEDLDSDDEDEADETSRLARRQTPAMQPGRHSITKTIARIRDRRSEEGVLPRSTTTTTWHFRHYTSLALHSRSGRPASTSHFASYDHSSR